MIHEDDKQYLLRISETFLDGRPHLSLAGPLVFFNGEQSSVLGQIREFWRKQLVVHEGYLLDPKRQSKDKTLCTDGRAALFVLRRSGDIVGTLRARVAPFELTGLSRELAGISATFHNYIELSRLVVASDCFKRNENGNSERMRVLLAAAVRWGIQAGQEGIIGLCRRSRSRLFLQYGIEQYAGRVFEVPVRQDGAYHVVFADWRMIAIKLRGAISKSELGEENRHD